MRHDIHFALPQLAEGPLRTACGATQAAANWTTVPALVTCRLCRRRAHFLVLAAHASLPESPVGGAPGAARGSVK